MIYKFITKAIFKSTTEEILNIKHLSMIIYTNYKLLYDYLIKLDSTQEK